MNGNTVVTTALGLALVITLILGDAPASAERVKLDIELGQPVALAGGAQRAYLRIALTGPELTDTTKRTPVNVAIVIDQSGSMAGDKIENAKKAAIQAVAMLAPDDIVSIVLYDDVVSVLVPATKVADRNRIYTAIESIQAGGSTALFAGVSKGAAEVRKFLDKNRVNRVILLSDGLANVGPSSPGDLAELGTSLIRENISVTTIGLGLDYNEDLMVQLAQKSDGNHMFAERASDLELIFAREFGDVLSVVAQDVEIVIDCEEGIRPIRCLGRDADIAGGHVTTMLNQLYAEQEKYILLEVEIPGSGPGKKMKVASVNVAYENMASKQQDRLNGVASVRFTDSVSDVEDQTNKTVMSSAVEQIGVSENKRAVQLRDEGKIEEAKDVLKSNADYLLENSVKYDNEKLRTYYEKNKEAEENLDEDNWKSQRKVMLKDQHEIVNQQKK